MTKLMTKQRTVAAQNTVSTSRTEKQHLALRRPWFGTIAFVVACCCLCCMVRSSAVVNAFGVVNHHHRIPYHPSAALTTPPFSAFTTRQQQESNSHSSIRLSFSASYPSEEEDDGDDEGETTRKSKNNKKNNRNDKKRSNGNKTQESENGFSNPVTEFIDDVTQDVQDIQRRSELKRSLLQYGASYDRGFGASSSARKQVDSLIQELEGLNEATNVSLGIEGTLSSNADYDEYGYPISSPLEGNWRMIWTSAQDVLILGASPLVTVGAIYQVVTPPIITNVIDFIPRVQALLPPSVSLASLLRAKVTTRASKRKKNPSMRIGLDFEKVQLQPVELLGQSVMDSLPPLGFDLPQLSDQLLNALVGNKNNTTGDRPGYFDVTFLDDEMLIIRQNSPGGLFVLVKTPDNAP